MYRRQFLLAVAAGGLAALGACVYPSRHRRPPPLAPAHGHRHVYRDVTLVYDSRLGVYVVSGRPDYYFYDGWYWRPYQGSWQISIELGGRWHPYSRSFRSPPPGLVKHYHAPPAQRRKHRF